MPVFWEFLFRTPLPNTNNYFVIRQRDISIAYQRKEIKRSFLLRKWKISLPFHPGFFLQSGEEEEGGGWIGDWGFKLSCCWIGDNNWWDLIFLNEGKRAGASDFPVQHKKKQLVHIGIGLEENWNSSAGGEVINSIGWVLGGRTANCLFLRQRETIKRSFEQKFKKKTTNYIFSLKLWLQFRNGARIGILK